MTEDRFFEKLRDEAQQLRYAPNDPAVWTRLTARIRDRVRHQTSVTQMLARWFRPITVTFVALSIVAAIGVSWVEQAHESANAVEAAMTSNSVEITLDGDTFNLAE